MNLQQFLTILWARKWLILIYLIMTLLTALALSLLMPKQYVATTSLFIEQRVVDPVTGNSVAPSQQLTSYIATQIDIITSQAVATKVVDDLKLVNDKLYQESFAKSHGVGELRNWIATSLAKKLTVKPSRESSIIQASVTDTDPQKAVKIANAFAQAYIQTTLALRLQPAQQNADWFEVQLNSLRQKMEDSREHLSSFQQSNGILGSSTRLDIEDARLEDIAQQLVANQGATYELMARKQQLTKALSDKVSGESLQEIISNSFVQSLKTDLSHAEAKFAELTTKVDKNHPQYIQAAAEVANLKRKITQEITTVLNGVNNSLAASKHRDELLTTELAKQKTQVLALKKQHNEIDVLSEEVANAQKTYDTALQRSSLTRMESEVSLSNTAVLNPAILPQKHDSPNLLINLILGFFLGTLLGIGAAIVTELRDRRIRTPLDLSAGLNLPVFGVLVKPPKTKSIGESV